MNKEAYLGHCLKDGQVRGAEHVRHGRVLYFLCDELSSRLLYQINRLISGLYLLICADRLLVRLAKTRTDHRRECVDCVW